MSDEQYRSLLDKLAQATDEVELRDLIERNLTRLDHDFSRWLDDRIEELREVDPDKPSRLAAVWRLIEHLAETGDYRKAQFDETNPANPKEVLLALAHRVEQGELELADAVDQGTRSLSTYPRSTLPLDWFELARSIGAAQDQSAYVTLAELMYQVGQRFPRLLPTSTLQAVTIARSAEAVKLREQHDYDAALQVNERLVTIGEECKDARVQVIGLMSMGDVWQVHLRPPFHPDHLVRAGQYYTQALQVCDQAGLEPALRADILLELGRTLTRQGQLKEGINRLEECLSLRHSPGPVDTQKIYSCLIVLAQACEDAADYRTATLYLQEAIVLAPDLEAWTRELARLAHMLSYLDESGSGEALTEAAQLADSIVDQSSANELHSTVYGSLGTYRTRTGDLQGAIDAYQVAIQAAVMDNDEETEARWLSNLGQVYMLLGQWKEADSVFQQAGEVHLRLNDNLGAANLFMNYGHLLFGAGDLSRAGDAWASAYALFHQAQRPTDMGIASLNLGRVHREMGDLQRAEACIHYCLSKAETSGTLRHKCYALGDLASLQARQNKVAEAVVTYGTAIDLAHQIGDLSAKQDFRVMRGRLLEEQPTTLGEAEAEYRRSVELLETIRGRLRAAERRVQIQRKFSKAYAPLICLLSRQPHRPGAILEALVFVERARSRTLVELMSRTQVRQPESLPQPLASREAELLTQLLRLEESEDVGVEPAQRHARLNQELEETWRQIAAIDEACHDYVDLRRTPLVELREILDLLKD